MKKHDSSNTLKRFYLHLTGSVSVLLHGLASGQNCKVLRHALTMDADGQHSTAHIGTLIALSLAHPDCMILGRPLFDASAPRIRVFGHKIANFCTGLLTPRGAIGDSLFGFRVYPINPLIERIRQLRRHAAF